MLKNSLRTSSDLLHQQINHLENISEQVSKAEALLRVASDENFFNHCQDTIQYYMWALSDLMQKIRVENELYLHEVIQMKGLGREINRE